MENTGANLILAKIVLINGFKNKKQKILMHNKIDYEKSKTKEGVKVKKEKFCPTCNEEAETHIWIDFCLGQVIVETNKKATYDRLLKKLGEPNKKQYVKERLIGAIWKVNFEDKEKVRQILSKTNIIGQAKRKFKESI